MKEAKRILLSPGVWGLLALLLAINVMLLVGQDTHPSGFYRTYRELLASAKATSVDEAFDRTRAELEAQQDRDLLLLWQDTQDPEIKAILSEECQSRFGQAPEKLIETMELSFGEEEMEENACRREATELLLGQLTYLRDYPSYLSALHENARSMRDRPVFGGSDSFSGRNVIKTGRDFPQSVSLELGNDFTVNLLAGDSIGGYSLLVFVLYLVLRFSDERKNGLWTLVYGASRGRGALAAKRALILLAGAVLGTVVLLGGKLLFGILYYGDGDLHRCVQSAAVFSDFPYVITMRTALLLYLLIKAVGMWLVGLMLWAVVQSIGHLPLALAAAGAALAGEFLLFRFIPDSFSIVIFRYLNVFAITELPKAALRYLNINVFGYPVQGFLITLSMLPVLTPLCLAANVLLAAHKKPVTRKSGLLTLSDRLRVPVSKLCGRLKLFGAELYKTLILGRGIWVLLALGCILLFLMPAPAPDPALYDTDLAGISASMAGPIDGETLSAIDEKTDLYASWEPSGSIVMQLRLLSRLREKVVNSLDAGDGLWLIAQEPYAALLGNTENYQKKIAVLLIFSLTAALSGVFSAEREAQMTSLIRGSLRGRAGLWSAKLGAAGVVTVLIWFVFELGELKLLLSEYSMPALSAPLQSFDGFADLPYRTTLGAGLAACLLLRLLWMLSAAGVILVISSLCRRTSAAFLAGCACLVLPACLSYMGLGGIGRFSAAELFSPYTAALPWYCAFAALAVCCLVTYVRWVGVHSSGRFLTRKRRAPAFRP